MLSRLTGRSAREHEIECDASGKLRCPGGFAVSLSHSEEIVTCVISALQFVGIDVESTDSYRDTGAIAEAYFSAEESSWLKTQPSESFYKLWTLKEASGKAAGHGVFGGLNRFTCTVVGKQLVLHNDIDQVQNLALYRRGDHFLAVAAPGLRTTELRLLKWSPDAGDFQDDDEFLLEAYS